jgi:protein involved in polysaccharide export with SLBB domain
MKKTLAVFCALTMAMGTSLAQTTGNAAPATSTSDAKAATDQNPPGQALERLSLATSSDEYPVTPADIYNLTYRRSTGDVQSQPVQVSSDYSVDIGIFGKINAYGMTFVYLKQRVEALIDVSYARSYPSLTIVSVGVFRVGLNGDTVRPRFLNAWGLSRLSELVEMASEPGVSLRTVDLTPLDGKPKRHDLLKARVLGDESQNPFVRPGDTITLFGAKTAIKLSGEIRKAGSYELLPGEGLRVLVEKFGGGLSEFAETTRIRIDRMTDRGPSAEYIALADAYKPPISLEGCIAVSIPSKMSNRPFVWFEGAVAASTSATATATPTTSSSATSMQPFSQAMSQTTAAATTQTPATAARNNRISVQIYEGEMLSDALREMRNSLLPTADLSSAALFRHGSIAPILVDLQPLLAMSNPPSDIKLQPYDRIYIPTLDATITVFGAVMAGAAFAYQPNSPASYYIGLAGGIDPERSGDGQYWILDQDGRRKETEYLAPGDRIYVPTLRLSVSVNGAVFVGGAFPYRPDSPASYYISLAGGIDFERNEKGDYWILDEKGKRKDESDALVPGDRIYVPANGFTYNFFRYTPLITGIVTMVVVIVPFIQSFFK